MTLIDYRALCEELADKLAACWPSTFDPPDCLSRARAALAESEVNDHKVASEDTMRRIRSTTKRWKVSVIISTNDSSIDTRIGCGIWKCLDIEREILESVSLPVHLTTAKETTND